MELIGIVYLKLIILFLFTFFTALIDAEHYNKHQWVENKVSRVFSRAVFILALSIDSCYEFNIFEIISYSLVFWGLFDQLLNGMRKDVDLWHTGNGTIDSFSNLYPHIYWGAKIISIPLALVLIYYFVV